MIKLSMILVLLLSLTSNAKASLYCDCVASKKFVEQRLEKEKKVLQLSNGGSERDKKKVADLARGLVATEDFLKSMRAPASACTTKYSMDAHMNCIQGRSQKLNVDNGLEDNE